MSPFGESLVSMEKKARNKSNDPRIEGGRGQKIVALVQTLTLDRKVKESRAWFLELNADFDFTL